jgi:hypothetical protein
LGSLQTSLADGFCPGLHLIINIFLEFIDGNIDFQQFDPPSYGEKLDETKLADSHSMSEYLENFKISNKNKNFETDHLLLVNKPVARKDELRSEKLSSQSWKKIKLFLDLGIYSSLDLIGDSLATNKAQTSEYELWASEFGSSLKLAIHSSTGFKMKLNGGYEVKKSASDFQQNLTVGNDSDKSINWCLLHSVGLNLNEQRVSKIVKVHFEILKSMYEINVTTKDDGTTNKEVFTLISKESNITVDSIKERMVRLVDLEPRIKSFILKNLNKDGHHQTLTSTDTRKTHS